jgi:hypothetical protein
MEVRVEKNLQWKNGQKLAAKKNDCGRMLINAKVKR